LSGVPVLAATLARALGARGHEVVIFARGANPEMGVTFRKIDSWAPGGFDVTHTFASHSLALAQVRACRRAGTRVLHSHVCNVLVLEAMSGRLPRQVRHSWYRACVWNELRAGRLADAVTVVSRRVAREMAWVYATPRARMFPLPNCHPATPEDPRVAAELRRRLGAGPEEIVFLFAGRDEDPIKRAALVQEQFLRLHRDFPRARLWMMPGSTGVSHPAIVPTGRLSVEEGDRIYQAADVFVNASLYDGMPVSVLQALAAGKPTIATAAGGSEDVITDGENGLLLPRSAAGLEIALRRLAADAALRSFLGAGARLRARDFAPEVVAVRLEGIYRMLVGEGQGRESEESRVPEPAVESTESDYPG
jgi:glycosyltransferase involved in cell wall biosynthesis